MRTDIIGTDRTFTKLNNEAQSIIYHYSNMESFKIRVLGVDNYGKMMTGINVYVSPDGSAWTQINTNSTAPSEVGVWVWNQVITTAAANLPDNSNYIKIEIPVLIGGNGAVLDSGSAWVTQVAAVELFKGPSFGSYVITGNTYITNIAAQTTVSSFINNSGLSTSLKVEFYQSAGPKLGTSDFVGTGTTVNIKNNISDLLYKSYTLRIYGDVNGVDGINIADLSKIKMHLLRQELLTGEFEKAGDLSSKGRITISDLLSVKKHILGLGIINQDV
jgi:hypothetical protein